MTAGWFAILISGLSVLAWAALLVKSFGGFQRHVIRRPMWLAMPIVGLLASVGTLASAIGFAYQTGLLSGEINQELFSLVASMGRGALLMGAVISLGYFRGHR